MVGGCVSTHEWKILQGFGVRIIKIFEKPPPRFSVNYILPRSLTASKKAWKMTIPLPLGGKRPIFRAEGLNFRSVYWNCFLKKLLKTRDSGPTVSVPLPAPENTTGFHTQVITMMPKEIVVFAWWLLQSPSQISKEQVESIEKSLHHSPPDPELLGAIAANWHARVLSCVFSNATRALGEIAIPSCRARTPNRFQLHP